MKKEEFMVRVAMELSRALPDKSVVMENKDDFSISVLLANGTKGKVFLHNAYLIYIKRRHPTALKELVGTLISSVLGGVKQATLSLDFIGAKNSIYPFVKHKDFLEIPTIKSLKVIYTPYVDDLVITYVVDSKDNVMNITENHLLWWSIDREHLHTLALYNFIKDKDIPLLGQVVDNSLQIFTYNTKDGYDATRILLGHRLVEAEKKIKNDVLIGIPNRDFLIVFPIIFKNRFAQLIKKDFMGRAHGISNSLYSLKMGKLSRYIDKKTKSPFLHIPCN